MDYNLKNKRVLVTGGAGFIGSHTVDALVENGAEVAIIDNLSSGLRENLNPKAAFYQANLGDDAVCKIMDELKPHIIYHFAFFVFVPKSVENPLEDMDVLSGTLKILKKCRELKIEKFVFASSGFLYGNNPRLPVKETEPVDPISPYVVSKHAIENYLKFFHGAFGIPFTILRYAAVYGPRQRTGAMADYIRKLAADKQAEIWGNGNKTRDYVFIRDVVNANLLALKTPDNHSCPIFNIGTAKETTLNDLYGQIAKMLGKRAEPVYHPDRPGEQVRYALDSSKIKNELGWQVQFTLEEGLKQTIEFAGSKNFKI